MSVELNVNGVIYRYPETGDTNWGSVTTQWAQAITNGALQKAGGSFILTNNVDFGPNFGLYSSFFGSRQPNPALSGVFRLANTDAIAFRDDTNSSDLLISIVNNTLAFEGSELLTAAAITSAFQDTATIDFTVTSGPTVITADVATNSITNTQINSSAAIARSKLDFGAGLVNSDLSTSAAIAFSKMASLIVSRALVSDGSGVVGVSNTTATEIGYVSGATSNLQTQITGKVNKSGDTMTGFLVLNADPVAAMQAVTKQYVDAIAQGLQVKTAAQLATTANVTLNGEQTIDGILTSVSRILVKNQSDPTQNGIYNTNAGAWTRSTDMDVYSEFIQAYVFIQLGTVNGFSSWFCTAAPGGTLGVTPINWAQFSLAGQISTDGEGLELTGTVLSLELDGTTLSKSGSGLKVNQIANAQIASGAAIALNKLAAVTTNRALISDGSGFVSVSSVTNTELGYVSGVTSAIQTQINTTNSNLTSGLAGKQPNILTTTGDIIYSSSGSTGARLPIGTTGQILGVSGGIPAWQPLYVTPTVTTVTGTLNIVLGDMNTYFLIDTTAARTVNLPAPSAGLNFVLKDKSGQCATNNITVVSGGGQIEGVNASKVLQTNWGFWRFMSDGTNWFIVS